MDFFCVLIAAALIKLWPSHQAALIEVPKAQAAAAWVAPLGIPTPPWPSNLNIDRPTPPSPWTSDVSGFYYVDPTGCSDARANGHPGASRCTMPGSVAAGAVIFLNGTITNDYTFTYNGNSASPIWILSYNTASPPVFTGQFYIQGSYLIFQNLIYAQTDDRAIDVTGNHIMFRDSAYSNAFGGRPFPAFGFGGTNLIFYHNAIVQSGNWQFVGPDIDRHGIKVYAGSDVWIVDSQFFHIQGDGVQVGDQNNAPSAINRVYIGRNTAYENLQSGFWTKNATDVIMSSNTVYNMNQSSGGGPGIGIGGQYDPKYIWFLNNNVYNSNIGINIAGGSAGGGGPWIAIGNIVHSISSSDCSDYGGGPMEYRNDGGLVAMFNTIYDVDMFGGFPPSGGSVSLFNNIYSNLRTTLGCTPFETERTITTDYNLYSSAANNPGEVHGVNGDPKFVTPGTDFSLQSSSPAIDKANAATADAVFNSYQARYGVNIKNDILGTVRPQGTTYDIGAYESTVTGGGGTPVAGDINGDHIVNSADYSILNSKWFTTDATCDLNKDGLVNSIDFSIMSANWLKTW